jgi:heme A synthase
VGLVLLFIVWVLTNDRKGIVERILWVILLVVYFLGIVGSILAMFSDSPINTVVGLCGCLMYLLAFIYLFDESVKKKFGM